MIVAEQLTWIATGLDLASAQADRLAAEVTTDPQARRQVAADILRGRIADYAGDLRALADQINKENQ